MSTSESVAEKVESALKEEAEYILLELEDGLVPPATNCPFSLSGLDTMNPILELGDGTKLIGHYEETIGTCLIFSEQDEGETDFQQNTEVDDSGQEEPKGAKNDSAFEPNPLYVKGFPESNPAKRKRAQPVCCLQKKLKFRAIIENDEKKNLIQR